MTLVFSLKFNCKLRTLRLFLNLEIYIEKVNVINDQETACIVPFVVFFAV